MAHTGAPTRTWWAVTACGLVAAFALGTYSTAGPAWSIGYTLVALTAAVVSVRAAARMPAAVRSIWWGFAVYVALTAAADTVYVIQSYALDEDPFPGPGDVLYLAAYVAAIVALARLNGRIHPSRDAGAWTDALVITLAVGAILTVTVFAPAAQATSRWDLGAVLGLVYPLLDLAIVAMLVRLLIGLRRLVLPLALVALGFVATLLGDLIFNVVVVHGDSPTFSSVIDGFYSAALVLLAAAATVPDAPLLASLQVGSEELTSRPRAIILTFAVFITPLLTLLVAWPDQRPVEITLAVLTIAVIALATVRIVTLMGVVQSQASQLGRQARTDALTGLPNRRTLDYEVERSATAARSSGRPMVAAMLDLDHFKEYNDAHGHQAGDDVLRAAAYAWTAAMPTGAFLARYGGEEFVLLLPDVTAAEAGPVLEGIRRSTPPDRTVSIGFAELLEGEDGLELLHRADRALYAAKATGRDRVVADLVA